MTLERRRDSLVHQVKGCQLANLVVGDLNRDGISDLAIGAPGKGPFGEPSDYPGETYVFFGGYSTEEVQYSENDLQGDIGFVIRGIRGGVIPVQEDQPRWGDMSGQALDFAGDINNDGIDDMIIGASQTIINPRRTGNGQTYVVFGRTERFPSRLSLADLDGFTGFRYNGIGTTDYSGFSISRAGDFGGDGLDDFIIGAAGEGVSYVMYGRQGAFAPPPARIRAPGNLRAEISSAASLELRWNRSTAPIGHARSLGQLVIRDRVSATPIVHVSLVTCDRVSATPIVHVSLEPVSSTIARRARVPCCVVAGVKSRSPVYFFFVAIRRRKGEWAWLEYRQTPTEYRFVRRRRRVY